MNGTWLETIHSRCYVFKRDRRTASRWLGIGAATRDEEGKGPLVILDRFRIWRLQR